MEGEVREGRQLMKVEESAIEQLDLEDSQLAEQLYNSAGLDPVVDAGLRDYDKHIERENKLINKVLGPSGADIRGYGESVAKRVAFAIYSVLNKQYGGKVGDMRSYIMTLEDERNRANDKFDELMGRVVGILGNEYKELRTDSKAFMEQLTSVLGEDLKASKIDQAVLAERLGDIDGLRTQINTLTEDNKKLKENYDAEIKELKGDHRKEIDELKAQIKTLNEEKKQSTDSYEIKIAELTNEYNKETGNLSSQIAELDSRIKALESERDTLTADLKQLTEDYEKLKSAINTLSGTVPYEQMEEELGKELYEFLLKDSKVPHMVIDGVGKFIDFKKYLGMAARKGAEVSVNHAGQVLGGLLRE